MFAAPILRVLILLLTPLNAFFRWYQKFLLKLFRVKADRSVTEAELLTFVGEVREEGGINSREEEMIRQAIEFDDLTAADILTPRIEVKAVEIGAALDEIENLFYKTGYSRLPVYRGSLNNIIGVLLLKDFQYLVRKQGKSLDAVLKPVELVAKSMGAPRLLRTFQEKKTHLAAVIDEYGDTLGIITIEDIIEELVGEIWDEHDQVVEDIAEIAPGRWRALGSAGLEDVFSFFGIDCEDEEVQAETARHITLAAWALDKLDGFPRKGAEFAWRGLVIKVGRMSRHRIVEVIISREKENSA